jgi:hypothetical protein
MMEHGPYGRQPQGSLSPPLDSVGGCAFFFTEDFDGTITADIGHHPHTPYLCPVNSATLLSFISSLSFLSLVRFKVHT